mmetsp:Transcript_32602/g.37187  ORF Transcript_32602/g.37187 Transcript_32602/m.37187 type:complete len:206 (-) Transcript_32602:53-670(-)
METTVSAQKAEEQEEDFEITGVKEVTEKLADVEIGEKKEETKLSTNSKAFVVPHHDKVKLEKTNRVFKPKEKPKEKATDEEKHTTKLENTGRTFIPPQSLEEGKEAYDNEGYDVEGYPAQDYADYSGFDVGAPEYDEENPDVDDVEDDFLKFQNESEQIEIIQESIGEFGEGLIRFEPSSKDCECCQGLVERCDGEICQTLGECY